ncbi:WG repeat-containing protein [Aetokthonos hydrillicola Thurmond2011]|jgi:serine/threonine protein kinase|uniref:WG repeat-containing protein n=1 Tax=Aetokthonos hydrillicola Thurmond2011 TaxID=2712845 RepID=A0AAP5MAE9_9CYAN|nr:WG repeat-containing protein [Aetokthonos hydrillicola]MBO3458892.1 protein kinase [Aetokthonos hydrillicola CCALA 1050]MBW4587260.1 WG repeat-containing protein [Aetokthonos hydrillicola CCALA 1050]MDR9896717.1 WG repeat-containing protein [Aetokthonos hydrillicola Thurmond2011]
MLLQGTILRNRYQIIRHLGTGGFADTYLAEDRDLPGHPQCVVKHLKLTSPSPSVLPIASRLFETEAQVLYLLGQHDQIPKLFAHFQENGEFYLVQEFIDGNDLTKELTLGKRFSEQEVIKLLQGILEVLVVVHERSIIHRDIKPQNLIRRRKDGKIVLIDFGSVKEIGTLAVNTEGHVRSTIAVGTPGYMPSEQANGSPKFCSDIYAVGMVGIQALTGLLPQQLLQDTTTGELIWRNYVQVSDLLADILSKMVRYHFAQRYQSASEALQALNALAPRAQLQLPPTSVATSSPSVPLISRSSQSFRRRSILGFTFLAIGVLATVFLINRSLYEPIQSTNFTVSPSNIDYAIKPTFDAAANFSDGLARVRIEGRTGYIDNRGKVAIQPLFDGALDFSEGLALVWISGQNRGFINKTGRFVIQPQFARNAANKFSEGLASVCIVSTCGYMDKSGSFTIDRKFTGAGNFSEGLAPIKTGGKWGYIDKSGNIVIKPQFNEAYKFSQGLAVVKTGEEWSYIDKNGNIVIRPEADEISTFFEGVAAVKVDGKIGYIDKSGKLVIKPQFVDTPDKDITARFICDIVDIPNSYSGGFICKHLEKRYNFSEGLAAAQVNGKWGYIDISGNFVIPPTFEQCGKFSEGLAFVCLNGKCGYIRHPYKQ